jgi:hypothetical protein
MGKRTLTWVQAKQILVRLKTTRTSRIVELRPTPARMERITAGECP